MALKQEVSQQRQLLVQQQQHTASLNHNPVSVSHAATGARELPQCQTNTATGNTGNGSIAQFIEAAAIQQQQPPIQTHPQTMTTPLPDLQTDQIHHGRIFQTNSSMPKNIKKKQRQRNSSMQWKLNKTHPLPPNHPGPNDKQNMVPRWNQSSRNNTCNSCWLT